MKSSLATVSVAIRILIRLRSVVVSPLASRAITWVLTYALNLEMSESKAIILVSREDRAVRMNETVAWCPHELS
jgi:hypothetical protein